MRIRVLDWQLDTRTREISGPDGVAQPRRQVYEVFLLLLERAPSLVTKGEIVEAVWEGRSVSDSAIAQVVRELRALLGDDPMAPRLIATRHRQGYQCIAAVEILEDEAAPELERGEGSVPTPSIAEAPVTRSGKKAGSAARWLAILIPALVGLVLVAARWWLEDPSSTDRPGGGWPTDTRAATALAKGLAASRRLESATALSAFEAAARVEDTPRLLTHRARLLLRLGRRSEARALAARLSDRLPGLGRADQLLAEALAHEIEGRSVEASRGYAVLSAMHPSDTDFALACWETGIEEPEWEGLARLLASPEVPIERRLLLSAQAAGLRHERGEQLSRARSALLASEESAPVIAALARIERSAALAAIGGPGPPLEEVRLAIEALLEQGEVEHALWALRSTVERAAIPSEAPAIERLIESLGNALGASPDLHFRSRLAYARGRQLGLAGRPDASVEAFDLAARHFAELGSPRRLEARRAQAEGLIDLGKYEEAREVLLRALEEAVAPPAPGALGASYATLARASQEQGLSARADTEFQRALMEHRQARDLLGEAVVLTELSTGCLRRGDLPRARELLDEALPLALGLNATRVASRIAHQQARLALLWGDLAAGLTKAREAATGFARLGDEARASEALLLLATIDRYRADLQAAGKSLRNITSLDGSQQALRARWTVEEGYRLRELGRPQEARDLMERILLPDPGDGTGWQDFGPELLNAWLDLDSGRFGEAERDLRQALDSAHPRSLPHLRAALHELLGRALLAQGELAQAQAELETAANLLQGTPETGVRLSLALAEAHLERALDAHPAAGLRAREGEEPGAGLVHARQRLQWVADTAVRKGALLFAFEARVELLAEGGGDPREAAELAKELEERNLLRLRRLLAPQISLRFP